MRRPRDHDNNEEEEEEGEVREGTFIAKVQKRNSKASSLHQGWEEARHLILITPSFPFL